MEIGREMDKERSKKINKVEGKKGRSTEKRTEKKEEGGKERKKEERSQRRLLGAESRSERRVSDKARLPAPVCLFLLACPELHWQRGLVLFPPWVGADAALALQENGGVPGEARARSRRGSGWNGSVRP